MVVEHVFSKLAKWKNSKNGERYKKDTFLNIVIYIYSANIQKKLGILSFVLESTTCTVIFDGTLLI